jgi:hypothetical protein
MIQFSNADKILGMQFCEPSKLTFGVRQFSLGGLHLLPARLFDFYLLKTQAAHVTSKAKQFAELLTCISNGNDLKSEYAASPHLPHPTPASEAGLVL